MQDDYAAYQEEQKVKRDIGYLFAKIFQAIFALLKLLVKLVLETIKGVLQVFKIPIPRT